MSPDVAELVRYNEETAEAICVLCRTPCHTTPAKAADRDGLAVCLRCVRRISSVMESFPV